tara:strand:- start:166 stop:1248 length:1083 start_codon:yes stop_codon:yes gene_type:complete
MNVLLSIAVLGLLIFFHEAGHFLAAIMQKIKVSGFSIGFGPALFQKEINGINYSIRSLPLGGFVSFPDEETDKLDSSNDLDLLKNRPIYQRAIVISAGVIANLLLAWIVLIGQASFIGIPKQPEPGVIIMGIQPDEPASKSGLVAGDRIMRVNGEALGSGKEGIMNLVNIIQNSSGKELLFEKVNEEQSKIISITPADKEGNGRIGAQLQPNLQNELSKAKDIGEIINSSNSQFYELLSRTVLGYKSLITNFSSTAQQLSGPVKIVEIGAQLSEQGGSGLVFFSALVSINLAVLNSLPLPLLDGGQLVLLILESIRGKPVPEKIQLAFMQSGFVLLVGLSIILIIRDTTQLSLVQQLFNR